MEIYWPLIVRPALFSGGAPSGCRVYYLVEGDPVLGRGSFKVTAPGQLKVPHGLEVLDESRLPQMELDDTLATALEAGQLTAVNTGRVGWESLLSAAPTRARSV